jgi:hypothetical protein
MANTLNIPLEGGAGVKIQVDAQTGEVVIWEAGSEDAFYFSPEEWLKISSFVLKKYQTLNVAKCE